MEEKSADKEKSTVICLRRSCRTSGIFLTVHILVVQVVNEGKEGWECRLCNKVFAHKHALHALRHVLKIQESDIMICTAAIPERYRKRYSDLYKANTERQEAKKRSSDSVEESVARHQNSAVGNLLWKCGNLGAVSVQQSLFVTPSSTVSHLSYAGGGKHN